MRRREKWRIDGTDLTRDNSVIQRGEEEIAEAVVARAVDLTVGNEEVTTGGSVDDESTEVKSIKCGDENDAILEGDPTDLKEGGSVLTATINLCKIVRWKNIQEAQWD